MYAKKRRTAAVEKVRELAGQGLSMNQISKDTGYGRATVKGVLRGVRAYLPPPGTVLESYTFLAPEALWTGKMRGQLFVAVAEDRWNDSGEERFLFWSTRIDEFRAGM